MAYSVGSHCGKWSAFLEPLMSRRQIFHITKREDASRDPKTGTFIPPKQYEVEFKLNLLENEGDWGPGPATMVSPFDGELENFLRAIVNEAAKLGIVADNHEDSSREIKRIEAHLEDMRKLVFKS